MSICISGGWFVEKSSCLAPSLGRCLANPPLASEVHLLNM